MRELLADELISGMPVDSGTALIDDAGTLGYAELASDVFGLRDQVPRGGTAAVVTGSARLVAAAIVTLDGWAAEVRLPGDGEQQAIPSHVVRLAERGPGNSRGVTGGGRLATRWRLYTSGTTGDPKPVDHDLASLSRTTRPGLDRRRRWGLLYPATRMAGIQVVLQSLVGGASLVDTTTRSGTAARLPMLLEHRVDSLSATPSVWRQLLQSPGVAELPLRQITLGGEIADQLVLDALHRVFPAARRTHVYASTEAGAAFSVSDGRAGFPVEYLYDAPNGIDLDIRDDILHVRAPGTSAADADGYVSTGDIVHVDGDRVHFRGRDSGVVNVGGEKVWPERVERMLRAHPDVVEALVGSRSNPLSGSVLAAAVVPAADADESTLPARLRAHCTEHLSRAHVPATVRVVPSLEVADSGKVRRR